MIFAAYASSAAEPVKEAIYYSPAFWVAVAFVIFIAIFSKSAWKFVTVALDKKISEIEVSIEEATKLREEAQELLASYKRKIADAETEAETIIGQARDEASILNNRLTENLEFSLERREKLAIDRINQAEIEATTEVRLVATDLALEATKKLLLQNVKDEKADELIDAAVNELPTKLN